MNKNSCGGAAGTRDAQAPVPGGAFAALALTSAPALPASAAPSREKCSQLRSCLSSLQSMRGCCRGARGRDGCAQPPLVQGPPRTRPRMGFTRDHVLV